MPVEGGAVVGIHRTEKRKNVRGLAVGVCKKGVGVDVVEWKKAGDLSVVVLDVEARVEHEETCESWETPI